jgi:hypothetical protein
MESQKRKQRQFFDLAERFRDAADPEKARRFGEDLGRMVFGGRCPRSRPPSRFFFAAPYFAIDTDRSAMQTGMQKVNRHGGCRRPREAPGGVSA